MSKYEGRCHFPQDRLARSIVDPGLGWRLEKFLQVSQQRPPANSSAIAGNLSTLKTSPNSSFTGTYYYESDLPGKIARELLAKSELAAYFPQHFHHERHGNAQFTARQLDSTPIQARVNFKPIYSITPQQHPSTRAIPNPFRP